MQRTPYVPHDADNPPRIPAWELHALALRRPTVDLPVLQLGSNYQDWQDSLFHSLSSQGLSNYVHYDYPNTEDHRENNRRVKMALVMSLRRIPGVGVHIPACPRDGPQRLFDLVTRAVLARPTSSDVREMLLEFIAAHRSRFASFEEMALRLLYLRAMLDRAGVKFDDRAAASAVLHNLGRDATHAEWVKRILEKDRLNATAAGSVSWDALISKLCWLSVHEKSGSATGSAAAAPGIKMEE